MLRPFISDKSIFLSKVQNHVAYASVSPTTLRNMLERGGRQRICAELAMLPLAHLRPESFGSTLQAWTDGIVGKTEISWGPVRKALNLFLRDAVYNHYLRCEFNLDAIEALLEVPLDGLVMRGLKKDFPQLPSRPFVVKLSEEVSALYQRQAQNLADDQGIARVHLDLSLWPGRTT